MFVNPPVDYIYKYITAYAFSQSLKDQPTCLPFTWQTTNSTISSTCWWNIYALGQLSIAWWSHLIRANDATCHFHSRINLIIHHPFITYCYTVALLLLLLFQLSIIFNISSPNFLPFSFFSFLNDRSEKHSKQTWRIHLNDLMYVLDEKYGCEEETINRDKS